MKSGIKTLLLILVIVLSYACKEKEDPRIADHERMMNKFKSEYNLVESDKLMDGLYMKITDSSQVNQSDKPNPKSSSYVVVDLLGFYGEEGVTEVTNYDKALEYGELADDVVYGPIRLDVDKTAQGFATAVQQMQQGESAIILIAHNLAYGNYKPVLYEVDLYKVIDDLAAFDSVQFVNYQELLEINDEDTLRVEEDIVAYYKIISESGEETDVELDDTVTINLNAYYVETDPSYVSGFPGRSFYPIGNGEIMFDFQYGFVDFPISDIINTAVSEMNIGDVWEVLSPAQFAYSSSGYQHPYKSNYIVPANMAVHYRIELLNVTGQDDE